MQPFVQTTQINTHCLSFQTNGHGSESVYQERLSRLESDKECLILQVSERNSSTQMQGYITIAPEWAIK